MTEHRTNYRLTYTESLKTKDQKALYNPDSKMYIHLFEHAITLPPYFSSMGSGCTLDALQSCAFNCSQHRSKQSNLQWKCNTSSQQNVVSDNLPIATTSLLNPAPMFQGLLLKVESYSLQLSSGIQF